MNTAMPDQHKNEKRKTNKEWTKNKYQKMKLRSTSYPTLTASLVNLLESPIRYLQCMRAALTLRFIGRKIVEVSWSGAARPKGGRKVCKTGHGDAEGMTDETTTSSSFEVFRFLSLLRSSLVPLYTWMLP